MGIGESVSKGFAVAKKSVGLVLVLFVFGFIFNLLNLFLFPQAAAGAEAPPPSPIMIAVGVVFILLTIYFQAGSLAFIRDAVKTGSANLGNFTAGGGKYYLRLLVLGILVSLIIGVFVLLAALSAALLGQSVPMLAVPLAILFGALGLYFMVLLFLSPYASVVDDQGAKASIKLSKSILLKGLGHFSAIPLILTSPIWIWIFLLVYLFSKDFRSGNFAQKNLTRILGISALVILIGFGIGLVLGAILAGISFVIKAEMAAQIIFAFLSSIVNAFLGVFVTGAFMNFYLSLADRNNN